MQPRRIVETLVTPDGRELVLFQRGDRWSIEVDGEVLMGSSSHGSEEEMARIAIAALGDRPAPRILVGGLGMGFTLRATLDALGDRPGATVTVAEIFSALVEWNRTHLAPLARRPLDDPRVSVAGDVADCLEDTWDAILLDVDNGPDTFTLEANRRLYGSRGIARLHRALTPGGVVAVWSAGDDPGFLSRLRHGGFDAAVHRVRARAGGKGEHHFIFVGRRR